jgi:formate dehydrogenase subunit gamma
MDAGIREIGRRLYVPRYTALQRVNHWLTAILFVILALTGLSMFYPWLYGLAGLVGGGSAARNLHPWFGVALVVSFLILAAQFVGKNIPNGDDVRWAMRFRSVMTNDHEGLPDLGKYNAGQKGVYWSQLFLILILLATGIVVWQRFFGGWFTIPTQRIALLIHSLAAAVAIAIIIVHIYAGIWIKGTGRAMTRGYVTGGWAYLHHRKWLRETLARGDNERPVQIGTARHGND